MVPNVEDVRRARRHGARTLAIGATILGFNVTLFFLHLWPLNTQLMFIGGIVTAYGAFMLIFAHTPLAQQALHFDTRFKDLPGEGMVRWSVPMRLKGECSLRYPRPYNASALIGAALAGSIILLKAAGKTGTHLPWSEALVLPALLFLSSLAYAWAYHNVAIEVVLHDSELIIRNFGISTIATTIPYRSITSTRIRQIESHPPGDLLLTVTTQYGDQVHVPLAPSKASPASVADLLSSRGVLCRNG